MITLAGTFGTFHLAQDAVHFGDGQVVVGTYRGMTSHRGQQFIASFGQRARRTVFAQLVQHIARSRFGVGLLQHGRHAAHGVVHVAGVALPGVPGGLTIVGAGNSPLVVGAVALSGGAVTAF